MRKMSKLITANSWFEMPFMRFRMTIVAKALDKHKVKDMGPDEETEPLKAWASAGRWSVTCPHCGGGEYAWEEGWMMCFSCFNSYIGHKLRRVVFPEERDEIEAILEERPLDRRHWTVDETVAHLRMENLEHAAELLPARGGTR